MMAMTVVQHLRMRPALKTKIEATAAELRVSEADLMRMVLGVGLSSPVLMTTVAERFDRERPGRGE